MEIPYTVKARPDTGLWNAKVGIWLFLASEVMLFGGLFSSYIFLRVGADFPWPVHVLTVKWGFINTIVLIFSSVTVLQAWLALKMRKYAQYKIWMALTILCALGFMCIKAVEYYDKFHHYGVILQDGSVLEGHLPEDKDTHNKEYLVKFGGVSNVTLAARKNAVGLGGHNLPFITAGSDAGFLAYIRDGKAEFKDANIVIPGEKEIDVSGGQTITLSGSEITRLLGLAVAEAKKIDVANRAKAAKLAADTGAAYKAPALTEASVKLTAVAPLTFAINPGSIHEYGEGKVAFKDGTELEGKLTDDTFHLQADKVDVRRLIDAKTQNLEKATAAIKNSEAWRVLSPEWKSKFTKHLEEETEKFEKAHSKQNPMQNGDFLREAFTMELVINGGEPAGEPKAAEKTGGNKAEAQPEHAAAAEHEAGEHHHPEVAIAKKDIHFWSNFTPKYNNYFAIYFALTALHGLHVLAGALVLTYMLFFGKRIYSQDPEHQANRVETAGLFWHFVDLVWIFLFPLLYLM